MEPLLKNVEQFVHFTLLHTDLLNSSNISRLLDIKKILICKNERKDLLLKVKRLHIKLRFEYLQERAEKNADKSF